MVLCLVSNKVVRINRVAVWVKFGDFRILFPGLGISAVWRLVLAVVHCVLQCVTRAESFA